MCGFKISATEISGSNNDKWVFTFVAVKVENTTQEFCSFWYYHAICVCAFHGCNSVTGTLLETLFKVYNKESQILGEDYSSAVRSEPRRVNSAIFVMGLVTDYYDGKLPSITEEWFNDMSRGGGDFKEHRKHHPHKYPNQTRVEELILEGHNLYSTTTTTTPPPPTTTTTTTTTSTTTTSITTLTTSTTPLTTSQSSNSLNDPNDSSKKRLVKVTGGMIIVLVVIVISLVIFIIVALVIVRKKLKKTQVRSKKKTKRVTKTGDTENPKTVPALPSSEPSPKTDRTKTGELSFRPADDMDTINACQSNWSTMGGLTNVTQLTKF